MATLGLEGTMGLDFKALLNKGKTQLADAAKKEALKVAQKELDKFKPKAKEEAPSAVANIIASTGMSKTWLIVGGVSLVAVVGILLMSGKKKPKKAAPIEEEFV